MAGTGTGGMGIKAMRIEVMDIACIGIKAMRIDAMGMEGLMGIEGRGSSSARALWSPLDLTGGHIGSPMATHPW